MEDIAVNPLGRISATLKHGDTINLDILYVWAELLLAKLVSVIDRVVVGLEGVILNPVLKCRVIWVVFLVAVIR